MVKVLEGKAVASSSKSVGGQRRPHQTRVTYSIGINDIKPDDQAKFPSYNDARSCRHEADSALILSAPRASAYNFGRK